MAIEEVVIGAVLGGAITLVATWFAFWLQRRESRGERREQEDRLRKLLASDIELKLADVVVMHRTEAIVPGARTYIKPPQVNDPRTAFKALQANPTALPADQTEAVNMFFTSLDLLRYTREHPGRDPDISREIWSTTSTFVEQCGMQALARLGATDAVEKMRRTQGTGP